MPDQYNYSRGRKDCQERRRAAPERRRLALAAYLDCQPPAEVCRLLGYPMPESLRKDESPCQTPKAPV